jgi:proteasome assembly chaperone 2
VLEGDNRGDARMMATVVTNIFGLDVSNGWKEPKSWEKGLFGTPHEQTLYG